MESVTGWAVGGPDGWMRYIKTLFQAVALISCAMGYLYNLLVYSVCIMFYVLCVYCAYMYVYISV